MHFTQKAKKFWIKEAFSPLDVIELEPEEGVFNPHHRLIRTTLQSLNNKTIKGVRIKNDWHYDSIVYTSMKEVLSDSGVYTIGLMVDDDYWRCNVIVKSGQIVDMYAVDMISDTEIDIIKDKIWKV